VADEPAVYVGWLNGEQIMVTIWPGDVAEVATRPDVGATWGPPSPLGRADT
jgi:hypothetical protein